jgi:hypothetical protein
MEVIICQMERCIQPWPLEYYMPYSNHARLHRYHSALEKQTFYWSYFALTFTNGYSKPRPTIDQVLKEFEDRKQ